MRTLSSVLIDDKVIINENFILNNYDYRTTFYWISIVYSVSTHWYKSYLTVLSKSIFWKTCWICHTWDVHKHEIYLIIILSFSLLVMIKGLFSEVNM